MLTDARYSELANIQVKDVMIDQKLVYIKPSKSGKPRHVNLSPEGIDFFKSVVIGKLGDELVFTKSNGSTWGKNLHQRPLKEACGRAKVQPPIEVP